MVSGGDGSVIRRWAEYVIRPGRFRAVGIITWIVLGLIAGVIAKLIMPGRDPGGIIVTILIGIVGAVIGGFIASLLGFGTVTGLNLGSVVIAVIGAFILLAIYRLFARRGTTAY